MATLTIATLCGKEYESFLPKWKKGLPDWVTVKVYTDDSNGIFEAKNQIVHNCNTDYIWMIDVDDDISLHLKEGFFEALVSDNPDRIVLGADSRMLWEYIFKTSFIRKCYDEVNNAKKAEDIKVLDLVSCEDMIVTATKVWAEGKTKYIPTKGVEHTVNDISKTSSTKYNKQKLVSLYRSFPELMKVAKHLDYDFMKWIVLNQCKKQYWDYYRNFCSSGQLAECDDFINKLYGEIESE